MAVFPVVKGLKLRATKTNSCGLPIEGNANYLVTDGFVTATLSPVMRDAEELEQANAEGKMCVAERTKPERKYYTVSIVLCQVNTGLITLFNGWPQDLGWDGEPIGYSDQAEVESDFGVALEIWTGGKADEDCPTPANDAIFANANTSGKKYGYFLFFGTEFTVGDIEIGASVSNFTLSGITFAAPQWGRGPWNVIDIDEDGTAGRLLEPLNDDQHYKVLRTPIAPPEATPGQEACELDITGVFTAPNFYFGGPAPTNAAAVDVAPAQPVCVAP